jgi:vacuolar-type H+-ATPase subunit C/Vma6
LVRQLRSYEYADLKTCLHYLQAGRKNPPAFAGIGSYGTVKFERFPDLRRMLEDTEYDFILKELPAKMEASNFDLTALETEMDRRYYAALKDSLFHLSGEDRAIAERILVEEISLRNCTWALRLRLYFNKSPDETQKYLMDIRIPGRLEESSWAVKINKKPVFHGPEISLAAEAVESLEKTLEIREDWNGWKWEKFLNPEIHGKLWMVDPRFFQNAASKYLYDLAMYSLHTAPLAVSAIFCFIKLKQFEEDVLTSISEGLGLGMPCDEVFELLEVPL